MRRPRRELDRLSRFDDEGLVDVPKSDYPAELVYGSTDRPELVLITCGGRFDPETGYEENLVVVAEEADGASA